MIFRVAFPSSPPDFPAPWWIENQGTRPRVFVLGLLTGALARGHTLALSSKSTRIVCSLFSSVITAAWHPDRCGHFLLKPRVTVQPVTAKSLTWPTDRAREGSKVCKDWDQTHTVGLWLTHVASHFGQMFGSHSNLCKFPVKMLPVLTGTEDPSPGRT